LDFKIGEERGGIDFEFWDRRRKKSWKVGEFESWAGRGRRRSAYIILRIAGKERWSGGERIEHGSDGSDGSDFKIGTGNWKKARGTRH